MYYLFNINLYNKIFVFINKYINFQNQISPDGSKIEIPWVGAIVSLIYILRSSPTNNLFSKINI